MKWLTHFEWQLVLRRPEPGGGSMALKSKLAKFGFAVGVDHPLGCDMGDGSAELVTDLPVGAFAFVLEFCVRPKRKAQSLIKAQVR